MRALEITVLALVIFGLPAVGIVDALRRSDDAWQRAEQSRKVWIVVQLVLLPIGALLYFASIRPQLDAADQPSTTQ